MPNAIGLSDQTNILSKSTLSSIGEYSAKKSIFSPAGEKIVKKISPYILLSEVENCPKLHFVGDKLSRLAFFGEKLKNRVINI